MAGNKIFGKQSKIKTARSKTDKPRLRCLSRVKYETMKHAASPGLITEWQILCNFLRLSPGSAGASLRVNCLQFGALAHISSF